MDTRKLSEREINNIAVALTGIKLLYKIAQVEISEAIKVNFIKLVKDYGKNNQAESALDAFISFIPHLIENWKIFKGKDYEIKENVLMVHFEKVYKIFAIYYRQVNSEKAPSKREILAAAKIDKRVEKARDQVTKAVNIGMQKKRCLVMDISGNEELELYYKTQSDLPGNNEYCEEDAREGFAKMHIK